MNRSQPLDLGAIKQSELAAASAVHYSTISRLLTADPSERRGPSYDTLKKLQAGIRRITRRSYSVEQIAEAIAATGNGAKRSA